MPKNLFADLMGELDFIEATINKMNKPKKSKPKKPSKPSKTKPLSKEKITIDKPKTEKVSTVKTPKPKKVKTKKGKRISSPKTDLVQQKKKPILKKPTGDLPKKKRKTRSDKGKTRKKFYDDKDTKTQETPAPLTDNVLNRIFERLDELPVSEYSIRAKQILQTEINLTSRDYVAQFLMENEVPANEKLDAIAYWLDKISKANQYVVSLADGAEHALMEWAVFIQGTIPRTIEEYEGVIPDLES